MAHSRFSTEEVVARGKALYEQSVRAVVEANSQGKVLVIDIETGDYEVGEDSLLLSDRLHARHPDATLYAMRIGSPALGRVGANRCGS